MVRGEFAAIDAIRRRLPTTGDPDQIWIGDDAAAVPGPAGGWLLLAADTVVAGVHADLALTSIEDLGWKALAACVSDVAAMGGYPGHALVTVAGPPGTDLDGLYAGLAAAADHFGCPIVGGDLANSANLVVTVAVTGTCDGPPVRRSGARPGDRIWVTGPLGRSAAGLRLYRDGTSVRPEPWRDRLKMAHARPEARLADGRAARRAGATAMIDVSDGLTADIGHIAEMSHVGVSLDSVPVAEGATPAEAMYGGEDFQLVFTAGPDAPIGEAFAGLDTPIGIGWVTEDPTQLLLEGRPMELGGWEHRW